MKTIKELFFSALWGIASFLLVFFAVPAVFIATPDILWISLCIAVPVIASLVIFIKKHIRPAFVAVGMLVQFALLVLFRKPVSRNWGINLQGLGAFEYISLFVYPIVITVLSWLILKIFTRNKKAE